MAYSKTPQSAIDRIHARSIENPVTGCRVWQKGHSSQGGYPYIDDNGIIKPVHRVVYEANFGPIPNTPPPDGSDRYECHHRCGNKNCTNPQHLQLVTRKEHARLHAAIHRAQREAKAA